MFTLHCRITILLKNVFRCTEPSSNDDDDDVTRLGYPRDVTGNHVNNYRCVNGGKQVCLSGCYAVKPKTVRELFDGRRDDSSTVTAKCRRRLDGRSTSADICGRRREDPASIASNRYGQIQNWRRNIDDQFKLPTSLNARSDLTESELSDKTTDTEVSEIMLTGRLRNPAAKDLKTTGETHSRRTPAKRPHISLAKMKVAFI